MGGKELEYRLPKESQNPWDTSDIIEEEEITWANGCFFTFASSSFPASPQPEGPTGGLYGGSCSGGPFGLGHGCILVSRDNPSWVSWVVVGVVGHCGRVTARDPTINLTLHLTLRGGVGGQSLSAFGMQTPVFLSLY